MTRPTLDGLERELVNVKGAVEDIKGWNVRHDQKDDDRFEAIGEKYEVLQHSIEELKRMISEALRIEDQVEANTKSIHLLKQTDARNQPWLEILKDLCKKAIYLIAGAALAAALHWLSQR